MAKQTALQNLTDLVGTAPDVQPVAPKEAVKVIAGKMLTTMPEKLSALKAVEAAPEDRLAELSACLPRLAAGSQRFHARGSQHPRPRYQQEGRDRTRSPSADVATACRQLPITACAAGTT